MGRRRQLTPEERELWARIAASALAMRPSDDPAAALDDPAPSPLKSIPPKPVKVDHAPQVFRVGQAVTRKSVTHDIAPTIGEHLARQPVVMDRKAHRNMTRGKIEPDARLDLHGMTLAQAYPELVHFVLSAQDRGCRLALVITGKGKSRRDDGPIPERLGLLRHQVPHWLRLPPLGAVVMQVNEAHLKHGGSGAYYVYLRRNR